jgi:transposase-like protein
VTDEDFGSTTAVIVRVLKKHVTPTSIWTATVVLATAIGYLVNVRRDIRQHDEDIQQLKEWRSEARTEHQQDSEVLHKMDTQLAVMKSQLDDEVDRQREWREQLAQIAGESPHRKRK